MRRSDSEVRLYEWDGVGRPFRRMGTTYDCSVVKWTKRYSTSGTFSVTYPLPSSVAPLTEGGGRRPGGELLPPPAGGELPQSAAPTAPSEREPFKIGMFIEIGRTFYGVIEEVSRADDGLGGNLLTASGTDLLGLLARRVTVPPVSGSTALMGYDAVTGASESLIKHFVAGNAVSPAGDRLAIPGLAVGEDLLRGHQDDRYMTRFDNLLDVVSQIAGDAELGLSVTPDFDAGVLLFDVYEGVERLGAVSTNRGTATGMNALDSVANYKNVFYTTMAGSEFADETLTLMYTRPHSPPVEEYRPEGGEVVAPAGELLPPPEGGELPQPAPPTAPSEREPKAPHLEGGGSESRGENGFDRREVHLSISAQHPTPGEEYNELRRLAEIQMTHYEPVNNLTCQINPARMVLGEDYDLGDLLTVLNSGWGLEEQSRVVAVTAEHSGAGSSVQAHFGDENPGVLVRAYWRRKR